MTNREVLLAVGYHERKPGIWVKPVAYYCLSYIESTEEFDIWQVENVRESIDRLDHVETYPLTALLPGETFESEIYGIEWSLLHSSELYTGIFVKSGVFMPGSVNYNKLIDSLVYHDESAKE